MNEAVSRFVDDGEVIATSMMDIMSILQQGRVTLGFIGGAELRIIRRNDPLGFWTGRNRSSQHEKQPALGPLPLKPEPS